MCGNISIQNLISAFKFHEGYQSFTKYFESIYMGFFMCVFKNKMINKLDYFTRKERLKKLIITL